MVLSASKDFLVYNLYRIRAFEHFIVHFTKIFCTLVLNPNTAPKKKEKKNWTKWQIFTCTWYPGVRFMSSRTVCMGSLLNDSIWIWLASFMWLNKFPTKFTCISFSPVWMCMCRFICTCRVWVNDFQQCSHQYGFSPVFMNKHVSVQVWRQSEWFPTIFTCTCIL